MPVAYLTIAQPPGKRIDRTVSQVARSFQTQARPRFEKAFGWCLLSGAAQPAQSATANRIANSIDDGFLNVLLNSRREGWQVFRVNRYKLNGHASHFIRRLLAERDPLGRTAGIADVA